MPGLLLHSPAVIARKILYDTAVQGSPLWLTYATRIPDTPDEVVAVYDTAAKPGERNMADFEMHELHGIQIRVRSTAPREGYEKMRRIVVGIDQHVYWSAVVIDGSSYTVQSIIRRSDVLCLPHPTFAGGKASKEPSPSDRPNFIVNAVMMVRMA